MLHVPAQRVKCKRCNKLFYACRSDSLWCSERCRYKERMENAKFEVSKIPRSYVQGVTFNRIRKRWQIRIPEDKNWKYVGSTATLEEAIKMQNEILGREQSVVCVGLSGAYKNL